MSQVSRTSVSLPATGRSGSCEIGVECAVIMKKPKIVLWVKKPQKRPKTRLKTNQQPRFQCFSEDRSEDLFEDHRNAEDGRLPAGLRVAVGLFGNGGGRSPLKPAVSVLNASKQRHGFRALGPTGGTASARCTFTQDCSDTVPWIRKQTGLPGAYIVATFAP